MKAMPLGEVSMREDSETGTRSDLVLELSEDEFEALIKKLRKWDLRIDGGGVHQWPRQSRVERRRKNPLLRI